MLKHASAKQIVKDEVAAVAAVTASGRFVRRCRHHPHQGFVSLPFRYYS